MTAKHPYRPRDMALLILLCILFAVSTVFGQDPVPSFAPTGTGPNYPESSNATRLATPDSYNLRPYDIDASQFDFDYGAVNLNLVYRWEYRPGSTLYLVWTHSKMRYEECNGSTGTREWNNDFDPGFPFGVEPGNTFMAKISYWFSI